jgi:hypothetical protein
MATIIKKLFVIDKTEFSRAKKLWVEKKIKSENFDKENLSDSNFIRELIKNYKG